MKECDKNTKFFHKMANAHCKRNLIGRIKVNGEWVTEEPQISEKIVNNCQLLLADSGGLWRPSINGLPFSRLSIEASGGLEEAFH